MSRSSKNLKIAIYPGTFDPITLGHLNVIKRSLKVCDKLIIAVAKDSNKKTLFTVEERLEQIKRDIQNQKKLFSINTEIEVKAFGGLLINFAEKEKAQIIIRGLRAVSDFEYEFQLATTNSRLNENIQTVFIPASENHQFIASNIVKEIVRLGGDAKKFVTSGVLKELKKKFN